MKSRVSSLLLVARMNFPTAKPEKLADKILEKIDLQFEPVVSDPRKRVQKEVRAMILKKCRKG